MALSALALAAGASVAVSTTAIAAPAPAPKPQSPANTPLVPEGVPVGMLESLAPAIVGAAAAAGHSKATDIAAPISQAQQTLDSVGLPPEVKKSLSALIAFLDGSNGGGPDIPKNGPVIAQFLYPTVGKDCISKGSDSVGTALAVPGPAELPPPGPAAGQTGFVFTALGTKGLIHEQKSPMTVQWTNLSNGRSGTLPLTDSAHINPGGPATLTAIANTGPGRVIAVIAGSLTTQPAADKAPTTCSFPPTMGFFNVSGGPAAGAQSRAEGPKTSLAPAPGAQAQAQSPAAPQTSVQHQARSGVKVPAQS